MRTIGIVVLLTLFSAAPATAATAGRVPHVPHVRALTAGAAETLSEAMERSSVVRQLVAELEDSDVVVYLSDSMLNASADPPACLTFVSSAAGLRYLLVRIGRWQVAPWVCMACLAHELQHAVEVARAPEVQDADTLGRLYRRIGWESDRGRFESAEAKAAGNRARDQIANFRR